MKVETHRNDPHQSPPSPAPTMTVYYRRSTFIKRILLERVSFIRKPCANADLEHFRLETLPRHGS
eukprot:6214681-Pleurochrysis_carterae.AAC.10